MQRRILGLFYLNFFALHFATKGFLALIPISRTTLFRLERDKLFPQGLAITPHRKLWFQDELIAWQKAVQDRSPRYHRRCAHGARMSSTTLAVSSV